ncbi:MAG: hypothetical protein PVG49_01860 [Desulfobacteraceae bacterium]
MRRRSNRFPGGWLFALLAATLFGGCAGAPSPAGRHGIPTKHRTVVCGDIQKEGRGYVPSDIRAEFVQTPGAYVYIYTEWFDLTPGQTYLVRWDYYRAEGELTETKTYRFRPPEPRAYTAGRISLDPGDGFPPGIFQVEVYINDVFISVTRFLLAEDEEGLERLRSELEAMETKREPGS